MTAEVIAARCAYDFVRPRAELGAQPMHLLQGSITKFVRGILCSEPAFDRCDAQQMQRTID